jgi:hypothetical protein
VIVRNETSEVIHSNFTFGGPDASSWMPGGSTIAGSEQTIAEIRNWGGSGFETGAPFGFLELRGGSGHVYYTGDVSVPPFVRTGEVGSCKLSTFTITITPP